MKSSQRFFVQDQSQVAEARRSAVAEASRMGFGETESGKIALVVTEAATNLLKHAGGGELLIGEANLAGRSMLDILAIDKGPGMSDIARCLEDGYSTVGSPGTGLGAMQRLCSSFRMHSRASKGTAVLCRFVIGHGHRPAAAIDPSIVAVSGVSVAMKGESACGDAWAMQQNPDWTTVLVADGLGHGPLAADAALKAIEIFNEHSNLDPAALLERIHPALRSTRGAAVGIGRIDNVQRSVTFAGIGNISGAVLFPGGARQMVCLPGIAGHEIRSIRQFVYPWQAGALVALVSDGLTSQWSLRQYEELLEEDPALIAGILYRDFNRGHDDATVVVAGESRTYK